MRKNDKTPQWFFPLMAVLSFLVSIAGIVLVFKPDLAKKIKEWPERLKKKLVEHQS